MLETQTLTSPIKLDSADFPNVLLKLSAEGWKPALFESQRSFLTLAGVADKLVTIPTSREYRSSASSGIMGGDIFFRDDDMYYFIIVNAGARAVVDPYGRLMYRGEENSQPTLEVGIVSDSALGLEERLRAFVASVENSLKSSVDGRKARHMNFEWSEFKPRTARLDRLIQSEEKQSELKLNKACIAPDELSAANALSMKLARETLIELSQAVFVRERDFFNRKPKSQDEIKDALKELRNAKLLNVEYLLECRRNNVALTRLKDVEKLKSPEVAGLTCASCGNTFESELLSEGYSLSDLGRKMSRQSYWMTIWVTSLLNKLGVPLETILWNVSEAGDEVDILVDFLGQLWIFELKDREFGSGDAYPLNYRQVRYRATKAIIITTEKVSRDAKRVFDEVIREARRPERSVPIYIEGLDSAERILRHELSEAALSYASQRVSILGQLSGYNLSAVLTTRFGGQIKVVTSEEVDLPF